MLRAALLITTAAALRPPQARVSTTKKLDVVVVGGGISGLATALELARRGRSVRVVSRDLAKSATLAAGGMLAPQAERLEEGPLLDLCVQAREAWPAWLDTLDAPRPTLNAVGGFVSPSLTPGSSIESWRPPSSAGPSEWLDGTALRAMEPSLGHGVRGGWWYPLETWVDPVRAHAALLRTCEREGVDVRTGVDVEGLNLERSGTCGGVRLAGGDVLTGDEYCVAAGAWLRNLLPVPVDAQKGQMVALKAPTAEIAEKAPRRVVYGADCYAYALCASGFVGLVCEADLQPYDYLALVPVVAGAGGKITDWRGAPLGRAGGEERGREHRADPPGLAAVRLGRGCRQLDRLIRHRGCNLGCQTGGLCRAWGQKTTDCDAQG